jgi:methyl-accepting chemotaxis protein
VNDLIEAFVGPIDITARYVESISSGVIPEKITDDYKGDFGKIKDNLNNMVDVMQGLLDETGDLITATKEGRLEVRGDSSKFSAGWAELVSGVNELIEAFVGPIDITSRYIENISAGVIPEKITDDYKGDFGKIKNNLNDVIDVMQGLLDETGMLTVASEEGRLEVRGDSSKFSAGWAELIDGINGTLDAVLTPIQEAAEVLEHMAEGDLRSRVTGDYKGDHAKIKVALNTAISNLDEGLAQVAAAADQVASASEQISSGSQSLAQGTSEQASTLEEVASSLQELTAMSEQSAANSREAKSLADASKNGAGTGVANMRQLSDAVELIKTSSDETAKIVKTIDEIAFQTNLLALNAAVEAARAGDAGKGFAVVAEEVRNLAMRSAEAAKSTAQLIEESVANAENGVTMNSEVLENLEQINSQTGKVSEVMDEISAAGEQQSTGIEQINTAVEQMNQVTQQTAANAEESSSASEELTSQAEELKALVSEYTLSSTAAGGRGAGPRPRASRAAASTNGHSSGNGAVGEQGQTATATATTNRVANIPFDDDDSLASF